MRRSGSTKPAGSSPATGGASLGLACLCLFALMALGAGPVSVAVGAGCPNASIRTQQSALALPDCRAYELVSPADKGGAVVSPYVLLSQSSADGNALLFQSPGAFGGAEGAAFLDQYTSWRSPTGWTTEAMNPYQAPPEFYGTLNPTVGVYAATANLGRSVFLLAHDPYDRSADASKDERRLYLRERGGTFTVITPPATIPPLLGSGPRYAGSSEDMSRIFVQSGTEEQLTAEAPAYTEEAYEWHNGEFSLIGKLPGGEVAPGGARIGQGVQSVPSGFDSRSAVSLDGTQVVLAMAPAGSPRQLYLRQGGQPKLISTSQRSADAGAPAAHGATYLGSASANGRTLSTIFFVSPDHLTEGSAGEPEGDPEEETANELYAYDVATEKLTLLSVDTDPNVNPSEPNSYPGARVAKSWFRSSAAGDYVYFLANSMLTPGSPNQTEEMYVWHAGQLSALGTSAQASNVPAPISEDGTKLLFTVDQSLAPIPNAPKFKELYLYDATVGHWTCVSCNPDGPTTGPAALRGIWSYVGSGQLGIPATRPNESSLSSDGSRVFFEAEGPLVPRDTNGTWDVYEWRQGQIHLLSSGRARPGAHLIAADPDGRNVFIATGEQLVPEDTDDAVDAYDVREGGGFPYTSPPPACQGDACQGAPGAAPAVAAPASSFLAGHGNAAQKKKRKARCVPARKAKKGARKNAKTSRTAKRRCVRKHRVKKHAKHRAKGKGRGGKH